MSKKRTADTDLNHENWDKEDPSEHEEMGIFKTASKDVLEKRVIRTAKRRSQVSRDEPKKSAFSGFGGFNKSQPSSFDFLANLTNGSKNTNGASIKSDSAVTSSLISSNPTAAAGSGFFGTPPSTASTMPAFGAQQTSPFASTAKTEIPSMTFSSSKADSTVGESPFKIQSVSSSGDSNAKSNQQVSSTIFGVSSTIPIQNKSPFTNAFKQPVSSTSTAVQNSAPIAAQSTSTINETSFDKETEIEKARNKYYSKLKGLNESVSSWIIKHVEKTPLCFLSPIFKDYENYLKDIQEEYEAAKQEIDVKTKPASSEVKTFGMSGGTSLFTDKSSSSQLDAKTNAQPFGNTTAEAAAGNTNTINAGFFRTTSNAGTTQPSPSKTPTKGFSMTSASATFTNSSFTANAENAGSTIQGFSYGIKSSPSATSTSSAFASTNTNIGSPPQGFSFGITPSTPTSPINSSPYTNATNTGSNAGNTISPPKGFSFGISTPTNQLSPTNSLSAVGAAPFSFGIGSAKPFSFSSQTTAQQQNTEAENDEKDQPPKVEYTPIVEENSVFDKKCKIFVKKDGNFVDKGVGTLYVKKVEESGKHQLLVRANTNLGTVLLNLILASAVPTQRMGKNNVMLVCIPTPDSKPPPTPVLIRVKTSEEADEILETLDKYKS